MGLVLHYNKIANKIMKNFFSILGFTGFILLIPGIFYAFNITNVSVFLEDKLGRLGEPGVQTVIGFALIALLFLFGGGNNFSATFTGFVVGFFLVSTFIDVGFMDWFKDLTAKADILSNQPLNYIAGILVVLLGVIMSFSMHVNSITELAVLILLPTAIIVGAHSTGFKMEVNKANAISLKDGFKSLSSLISKKYQKMPRVQEYVKEVEEDRNLSEEEKMDKIRLLKNKIKKLEEDQRILNELKSQNEAYKNLIDKQKKQLNGQGWCAGSKDAENRVKTFKDGVVPDKPCVRDFAVSLASNSPGAYYDRNRGLPGKDGIKQICNIHIYLSSNWKYVSDPTVLMSDYYAAADRSIASQLAGDCDDYSILMASCIEAIGGVTRIIGGTCAQGGHAWAEVLIGKSADWDRLSIEIQKYHTKLGRTLRVSIDPDGFYWLPLDWQMGVYSCNQGSTIEVLYFK